MKTAVILALLLVTGIVAAQEISSQTTASVNIKKLGLVGKGIAFFTDPGVFSVVKLGLARVKVGLQNEEFAAGILKIDDTSYRLRNIIISNDSVSGDIFLDKANAGKFSLNSRLKVDTIIWFGTITINNNVFNTYILEAERGPKTVEFVDKIEDYCKTHSEDTNCISGIKELCKANIEESRCKQIFRDHCEENLDDSRCRHAIKKHCKDNSEADICVKFESSITGKFCDQNSNNERCRRTAEKIVSRATKIVEEAKKELEELSTLITSEVNATSVLNLKLQSEAHLKIAEESLAIKSYGKAFGQATAAKKLVENAERIIKRSKGQEKEIEVETEVTAQGTRVKARVKGENREFLVPTIINRSESIAQIAARLGIPAQQLEASAEISSETEVRSK